MSSIQRRVFHQSTVLILVGILIADFFCISVVISPVAGSPGSLKWRRDLGSASSQWSPWPAKTNIQPLAADIFGDGKMEVVVTGGTNDYTETMPNTGVNGTVTCMNGTDGSVIWQTRTNGSVIWGVGSDGKTILWHQSFSGGVGTHSPFEIADLNKDGILDIVVAAKYPLALFGNNGSVLWTREDVLCYGHYPAVYDIDGNGYPTIFVTSSDGPYKKEGGRITSLSHDGQILHQAYSWHPCWGGLTVGDANFDGKFELYQGDRSVYYDEPTDPYKWGGMGVQVLDAQTLEPLWNDEDILVSSHIPILADINNDGFLEIIVGDQGAHGLAVLNYDGTVCTTDGIWRKSQTLGVYSHSQPTVYDVDGDGNLEIITCNNDDINKQHPKIWDLRQWKLDATLDVTCDEPPKVGDVNGDGKMEIIACSNINDAQPGKMYIYDSNYQVVDTIPNAWASNMVLLQDVDGDNKIELIFTSGAAISAYATPTTAPTPRARSNVQFYSERRCAVPEYVPPFPDYATSNLPVVLNPSPADKSINVSVSISKLQFTLRDYQNNAMNYTVTSNPNIASGQGSNVPSGTTISVSITGSVKPLTKYTWSVAVVDQKGNWIWNNVKTFAFYTEAYPPPGSPPTQNTPRLVSSGGTNTTSENLICSNQSTFDSDGNRVQNTYIWYRNNVPIVALDMPFDTNPQYTAVVKDYSGFGNDGTTYNSWSKDTLKLWPSWGTGIVGGAYNFNENQFIKIPGNASLGDGTWTEITLECWIKPKDLSKQSTIIARKTYEGTIGSYMMGFQDSASNKLFWGVTTGGTYKVLNDSTTLNPNTWYHIVCTYKSGSGLKIYINGALSASMSLSGVIDVGIVNEDVYIGGSRSAGSANRYLNASLDEVRIYKRALSDQQILQRYSETKNGSSNSSTIVSAETSNLDVWSCKVTPNDSYQDGATKVSNTLTVIDSGVGAPHADIYIEHTWVGDLVVTIGVGKIDNPLWSNVVWNRKGGSQKNLTLTIDLTGKEQYLAPSSSAPFDHLWFVNVYDAATGDQGRVVWFNITYQETTYVSTDVPKGVFDYQTTSVYNPNAPSYPFASVYIEHTYIGDLNVTIGVGPTATPSWSKVVWNRQGGGTDNLNLTIDLSAAVNYLPPSGTNQWFLRVYDGGTGDQGRIIWFNITYQGQTYLSSDVPVNIADFKTSYAFIPSGPAPPSPPSANVVIQHSYVGDLNVTIGVGSRSSPSWSQVIWNRAGGRGTGSLNLTVDLSAAVAYLPPSADSTWFLRVYDGAAGDTGTITSFTITYQNQTFVSQDVPVSISDFQTSYANIPPAPSAPVAHVYIQHMWIGDLIVDIGVGNTTSPQWSNRIWNGTGSQGSGYLDLTIDLTDAAAYLPPSSSNTWFLKVYDRYAKDTGTIVEFTIKYMGTTYVSTDVPVPILDKQTSYAYISG